MIKTAYEIGVKLAFEQELSADDIRFLKEAGWWDGLKGLFRSGGATTGSTAGGLVAGRTGKAVATNAMNRAAAGVGNPNRLYNKAVEAKQIAEQARLLAASRKLNPSLLQYA